MTYLEGHQTLFPIKMTLLLMNNSKCRRDNKADQIPTSSWHLCDTKTQAKVTMSKGRACHVRITAHIRTPIVAGYLVEFSISKLNKAEWSKKMITKYRCNITTSSCEACLLCIVRLLLVKLSYWVKQYLTWC